MRAVRLHGFGDPSVLRVDEVPDPAPPRGDGVLLRVDASSVNGTDLGLRRGDLTIALLGRLPFVLGFDVAGQVLACGPRVTAFAPGDRVMALVGHGGGGQADRIVVRQHAVACAPSTVSPVAAASLPLAGLTALQALYGRAGLAGRVAPRVLVTGASGGIGSVAVQLAALAGGHVTAVASGDKLDFVAGLGADELVDRRRRDVATLGGRFDVVLDAAGTLAFAAIRSSLAEGGVVVSSRPVSPDALRALARPGRLGGRRGVPRFTAVRTRARSQDLARLAALVDAGRLRPTVDLTVPMADVAAAHAHAEGGVRGKVVVDLRA